MAVYFSDNIDNAVYHSEGVATALEFAQLAVAALDQAGLSLKDQGAIRIIIAGALNISPVRLIPSAQATK